MMSQFSKTKMSRKLFWLIFAVSTLSLLVTTLAFMACDVADARRAMEKNLISLSRVLASNSVAAEAFEDKEAATLLLSSLGHHHSVEDAVLFDVHGSPVATYSRAQNMDRWLPDRGPLPGSQMVSGMLEITTEVTDIDGTHGYLVVRANTNRVKSKFLTYSGIAIVIFGVTTAVSLFVSLGLQKSISSPIGSLTQVAERITKEQNYALRVHRQGEDEFSSLYSSFNEMLEQMQQHVKKQSRAESELECLVSAGTVALADTNDHLRREFESHRDARKQLQEMQQEIQKLARLAGFVGIATDVLRNAGHVLNRVNASASQMSDHIQSNSQLISGVRKAAEMLAVKTPIMGPFIDQGEESRPLNDFVSLTANSLECTQADLQSETDELNDSIDHFRDIVASQQILAAPAGHVSPFQFSELFSNALILVEDEFTHHQIKLVRIYGCDPVIHSDKQQILQVLVSLLSNAKQALVEVESNSRILTLLIMQDDESSVTAAVNDTGVGIAPKHLGRVFQNGFTTQKDGHGLGLYTSALNATELGGTLTADSEGLGYGSCFSLTVPIMRESLSASPVSL